MAFGLRRNGGAPYSVLGLGCDGRTKRCPRRYTSCVPC